MKNKLRKSILFLVLLALPFSTFADDIDNGNGNGDVQDVTAAPIDTYIPIAIITVLIFSYIILHRRKIRI